MFVDTVKGTPVPSTTYYVSLYCMNCLFFKKYNSDGICNMFLRISYIVFVILFYLVPSAPCIGLWISQIYDLRIYTQLH